MTNKGYHHGFTCKFCNESMPYGVNPSTDRYFSFSLNDKSDIELVGNGFQFYHSSFKVKDMLSYAYNDTAIIV